MDTMEIVFISALCFVFLSAIATLIFLFQSKTGKTQKAFKKKNKLPDTNSGSIELSDTTEKKEIIPYEQVDIYKKLNLTLAQSNLVALPNVRYSDIISVASTSMGKGAEKIYSQLPYLIADYVIFSYSDMKPLYIFNDVTKPNNIVHNNLVMELLDTAKIKIVNVEGFTNESLSKIRL